MSEILAIPILSFYTYRIMGKHRVCSCKSIKAVTLYNFGDKKHVILEHPKIKQITAVIKAEDRKKIVII